MFAIASLSFFRMACTQPTHKQGREVQQRLVAQRQKAAARAFAAKTTRNVSKARGKKAKATASALAEW